MSMNIVAMRERAQEYVISDLAPRQGLSLVVGERPVHLKETLDPLKVVQRELLKAVRRTPARILEQLAEVRAEEVAHSGIVPSGPKLTIEMIGAQLANPKIIEAHTALMAMKDLQVDPGSNPRDRTEVLKRMTRVAIMFDYGLGVTIALAPIAQAEKNLRGTITDSTRQTIERFQSGSPLRLNTAAAQKWMEDSAREQAEVLKVEQSGFEVLDQQLKTLRTTPGAGYVAPGANQGMVPQAFIEGAQFAVAYYKELSPVVKKLPPIAR